MNKFALPVMILNGIKSGAEMMVMAPYMIYQFFAGEKTYNWLLWPVLIFCLLGEWQCVFSIYRHGINGMLAIYALVVGIAVALVGGLAVAMNKRAGSVLAWNPGRGALRTWIGKTGGSTAPTIPAGVGAANPGDVWLRGTRLVGSALLARLVSHGLSKKELELSITWGGVPVPPNTEQQHFLIEGTTGAGKTQAINEMMRKVRQRKQAAIIADQGGGFLARFGIDGDLVLNPFDRRTVDWSPFLEIEADYDYARIAKAAIPDAEDPASQEWKSHAQTLFTECLRSMHKRGDHSLKQLLYYMTAASQKELADFLQGTPAAIYTQPGGERMLNNLRSTGCPDLAKWVHLADKGTFSVRQWIRQSDTHRGVLFLTYSDSTKAELRGLVACWLELALIEGLSLPESSARRLWYFMDELDSLGRITSLVDGLTKLRKYGGVCVSGLQTIAQLQATYGVKMAQTLLSCMGTKLILRAGDAETGKYFETEIGQQEVEREEASEGTSQQVGNLASNSQNRSVRRHLQSAVLGSELTTLLDLQGYVKLIGQPIAKLVMAHVPMTDINPPFEAKEGAAQ